MHCYCTANNLREDLKTYIMNQTTGSPTNAKTERQLSIRQEKMEQ